MDGMSKIRAQYIGIMVLLPLTMIVAVALTPAYIVLAVVCFIPAWLVRIYLWIVDGRDTDLEKFKITSIYESIIGFFERWETKIADKTPQCDKCRHYSPHGEYYEFGVRVGMCWKDKIGKEVPELNSDKRVCCFRYKEIESNEEDGTICE